MSFIDVGFSNYLDAKRIVLTSNSNSSPVKRAIKEAKEEGRFVDVTEGRKTRTIIYSECGDELILTAVAVQGSTIIARINKTKIEKKPLEDSGAEEEGASEDRRDLLSKMVH
jgi:Uncharacterized protein conserved in bacteria